MNRIEISGLQKATFTRNVYVYVFKTGVYGNKW